ncbi:MAG: hypothetical protein RQ824_07790 [bacterium]|nr:hypothetical protein [bacterium]
MTDAFFDSQYLHEMSAPHLIYSNMLRPELESAVSAMTNLHIVRGREERQKIEAAQNAEELIDIMRRGPDSLNQISLREKLQQDRGNAIPLILKELAKPQSDVFIELAVKVLHESSDDCSAEIREIITGEQREAYTLSLLCLLFGFYESDGMEKLLWDYYHYFAEHFGEETYSDGPLLGLHEMRERRREKVSAAASGSIAGKRGENEEETGKIS